MISLLAGSVFAQSWDSKALDKSPRKKEWVKVKQGDRTIHCFVVSPEKSNKSTTVLIVHGERGLSDWVRLLADQIAAAGYLAVAPDLLSGMGPNGGKTADFEDVSAAMEAFLALPVDQAQKDLLATAGMASALPLSNGKIVVAAYRGGAPSAAAAAPKLANLKGVYFFSGFIPENLIAKIEAPVYGFYGASDLRVAKELPKLKSAMAAAGVTFDAVTYPDAHYAFMREGGRPDGQVADRKAQSEAWKRWMELLAKY